MKKILSVLLLLSAPFLVFAQSEVATNDGSYEVVLMSLSEANNVNPMVTQLGELGYEVELRWVTVDDTSFSRLVLAGFDSLQNARASADQLKHLLGYDSIWVNKP